MRIHTGDIAQLSRIITPMLLEGDSNYLRALRNQYKHLVDAEVDFNGYGFYVNYTIDDKLRVMNRDLQCSVFTDMVGYDAAGNLVAGFQVFVSEGAISCLEGFPFGSHEWPVAEITPIYTYQPDEGHVQESETRFPQVIERIKDSEIIVTKEFLEFANGESLGNLPPVVGC